VTDKEYILQETLRLLGEKYPIGLYEYLYKYRPDLYKQLLDLEDRIDQAYINPNASIDQLKAVLREYWTFHIKAIQLFNTDNSFENNLVEARKEMLEERVSI